jgi:hypothetical protein
MYKHSKGDNMAQNSIRMVGVRGFADALGRFAVGLFAVYLSFQNMLVGLCILSFVMFEFAFDTKSSDTKPKSRKELWSEMMKKLFKPRKKEFWLASLPLMFFGSIDYAIFAFTLPVFLNKTLGLDYLEVGALIGMVSLVYALGVFTDSKLKLSLRKSLVFSFILATTALILMPLVLPEHIVLLLIIFAFGWGMGNSAFEKIVVWSTGTSKDPSTEIGVVHTPQRFMELFLLSAIGFIAASYGFLAVNLLSIGFVLAFTYFGLKIAKLKDKNEFLG